MKISHSSIFLMFLSLVAFIATPSCTKEKRTATDLKPKNFAYDSVVVVETIPLVNAQKEPSNKLEIHFVYPSSVDGDSTLLANMQSIYIQSLFGKEYASLKPKAAVDKFRDEYKKQYLATSEDYLSAKKAGLNVQSWGDAYQTMKIDTLSSKPGVISFGTFVENFNGGAHGSHQVLYFNVDKKTGRLIRDSDVFNSGYEAQLKKLIIEQLLADNHVKTADELIDKGFFDPNDLKLSKNFLLTKDGITYGFNEYEIAPYYMGLINVHISNSKLSSLLKK